MKRANSFVLPAVTAFLLFVVATSWSRWPAYVASQPTIRDVKDAKERLAAAGQFGDQFGALSCLLSGLTLVGVAVGVTLQWRQLRDARAELATERRTRRRNEVEAQVLQLIGLIEKQVEHVKDAPFSGIHAVRSYADQKLRQCAAIRGSIGESAAVKCYEESQGWNAPAISRAFECTNFLVHEIVEAKMEGIEVDAIARFATVALGAPFLRYTAAHFAARGSSTDKVYWGGHFIEISQMFHADSDPAPSFSEVILQRFSRKSG